jgi:hypothetical protein
MSITTDIHTLVSRASEPLTAAQIRHVMNEVSDETFDVIRIANALRRMQEAEYIVAIDGTPPQKYAPGPKIPEGSGALSPIKQQPKPEGDEDPATFTSFIPLPPKLTEAQRAEAEARVVKARESFDDAMAEHVERNPVASPSDHVEETERRPESFDERLAADGVAPPNQPTEGRFVLPGVIHFEWSDKPAEQKTRQANRRTGLSPYQQRLSVGLLIAHWPHGEYPPEVRQLVADVVGAP